MLVVVVAAAADVAAAAAGGGVVVGRRKPRCYRFCCRLQPTVREEKESVGFPTAGGCSLITTLHQC